MTEIPGLMIRALSEPQAWLWILYVVIPGWCLLPVFCRLLPYSRAAWYFMARVAGMGALAYIPWLLSHDAQKAFGAGPRGILSYAANGPGILPFDRMTLIGTFAFLCVAGAWAWLWWGRHTLRLLKSRIRILAAGEAVFFSAFAFGGALRLVSHGIAWHEKYMDMAFLRSCIDSSIMPPFDPWLYQLPINYYYGGYAVLATPAKLFATPPEIAYNLSLVLIFALTASMVFALGGEILARIRWALLSVFTVLFAGNFEPIMQFLRHIRNLPHADPFVFNWWTPSRVLHDRLPDAAPMALINEFPFFAHYHGDLHPHLLAMPFSLLCGGLVLHMMKMIFQTNRAFGLGGWAVVARFFLMAWSFGLLIWINPFDFVGWSVVLAVALLLLGLRRKNISHWHRHLICGAGVWIGLTLAAMIAVLPFLANYAFPAIRHVGFIIGFSEFRSNMLEFLLVWGLPLTIAGVWVALLTSSARKKFKADARFILDIALCAAAGFLILISGGLVAGLLIFAVGMLLIRTLRDRESASGTAAHAFLFSGLLLLAACELIFIRDPYGRALQRMNTVFKFHFIAWILIGLAVPYFLRSTLRIIQSPRLRIVYSGVVLALLVVAAAYPILATNVRLHEYANSGLGKPVYNGLRFMKRDHRGDFDAIQWLNTNVGPGTVILEATGPPYEYYSRFSVFSPARAVIGWPNHQAVWRGGDWQSIESDVHRIFASNSIADTDELLKKYNVQFVCIGWLEQRDYPEEGLQKFASAYPTVFESADGGTIIYHVADHEKRDK